MDSWRTYATMVKELTKNEFEELLAGGQPVFVDFFATWCGPCKAFAPILEKVSAMPEYEGKIQFGKVDVDKESELAQQYSVMNIPTLMLFEGGEVKQRVVGGISEKQLTELLG